MKKWVGTKHVVGQDLSVTTVINLKKKNDNTCDTSGNPIVLRKIPPQNGWGNLFFELGIWATA